MSWPPRPSELCESAITLPAVDTFLYTLMNGDTEAPREYPQRVRHLMSSFGQDIIYDITGGRQVPPKQMLLPYAVKSLTNNIELIKMLNRCGHANSQIEEINTVLSLQQMALVHDNEDPLPEKIQSYVQTTLVWDNIDRLEETLSGAGTSHPVNGLPSKPLHFGRILPQTKN